MVVAVASYRARPHVHYARFWLFLGQVRQRRISARPGAAEKGRSIWRFVHPSARSDNRRTTEARLAAASAQIPFASAVAAASCPETASRADTMTRTEILTRYRRLRQISKELHQAVLDIIAPDVELE